MPTLAIPYTFVNGTIADATQVDADFNAVVAVVNGIDFVNIGANGIYANQILPTNLAQATFGGVVGYQFSPNVTSVVPLTIAAPIGQTADLFDITVNAVKAMWVTAGGQINSAGINASLASTFASTVNTVPITINATSGTNSDLLDVFLGATRIFWLDLLGVLHQNQGIQLPASTGTPSHIEWGSSTFGNNAVSMYSDGTSVWIATGASFNGTNWIARATTANILYSNPSNPGLTVFTNSGLTIGNTFTPASNISIGSGQTASPVIRLTSTFGAGAPNAMSYSSNAAGGLTNIGPKSSAFTGFTPDAWGMFDNTNLLMGVNASGQGSFFAGVRPMTTGSTTTALLAGSGAPAAGLGNNGDYYFNQTGGAGTHIYFKSAGAWAGIV